LQGVWCPEGCEVDAQGGIIGEVPVTRHRGYWLNALYSPWLTFAEIAHEFLISKKDPALFMNFVNSWLAEEWTEEVERIEMTTSTSTRPGLLKHVVPEGTLFLTCGMDVQIDRVYYVVRAWMEDENTSLLEEGILRTGDESDFQQAKDMLLDGQWESKDGDIFTLRAIGPDAQYRANEVYAFGRLSPERIYPIRGNPNTQHVPYMIAGLDQQRKDARRRNHRRRQQGLSLWNIDTGYYKTLISRLVRQQKWHLPPDVSGDYHRQFASQHKITERDSRGRAKEVWVKKPGYDADHFLDCEVYAVCVADIVGYFRNLLTPTPAPPSTWGDGRKSY